MEGTGAGCEPMLDDYWTTCFANATPLAHLLRGQCGDRWVRFHSLPQSKRYAETEEEWATLLHRHNSVLGQLCSNGRTLQVLTSNWSATSEPDGPPEELRALSLAAEVWRSLPMHESEEDETDPWFLHVFHSPVVWQPGALDDIIRLVADDVLRNVMILDPTDTWLLHPYDGGMDVIARSQEQRARISRDLASWRSRRSDSM